MGGAFIVPLPHVWYGDLLGRRSVTVTGADRQDYLHRMLTQDVKGLVAGQWRRACFLDVRGRILADLRVWNLGDRLRLVIDERHCALALPGLERYVISNDVVFSSPALLPILVVGGEQAQAALERAGFAVPQGAALSGAIAEGSGPWVVREDRGATSGYEIHEATAACQARLESAGALRVDTAFLERVRIEQGVAMAGSELGPEVLFNEACLESAVAWGKGCFPGQEPVVMARDRGRPPRLLATLRVEATPLPELPAELLLEGRPAGLLTSLTLDGAALGYVRHAHASHGGAFELKGGGRAWLREVPSGPLK